jgi:membrane protease YdiL (CAAX protease family)
LLVTAIADGRAGVRDLLARALRWRVGIGWYAFAILAIPAAMLVIATAFLGAAPLEALVDKWPLLLTVFVPQLLIALFTAQLFEELGWTGFVQQRLQDRHGALRASLMVAVAFALIHFPTYLIGGPITGAKVLQVLVLMVPVAIFSVFFRALHTWMYNGSGRSVLIAALLHAVNNTAGDSKFVPEFVPQSAAMWLPLAAVAVLAVLAAVATRGRLAHTRDDGATEARGLAPAAALPTRPPLG